MVLTYTCTNFVGACFRESNCYSFLVIGTYILYNAIINPVTTKIYSIIAKIGITIESVIFFNPQNNITTCITCANSDIYCCSSRWRSSGRKSNLFRFFLYFYRRTHCTESSSWNEGQHECCHGSQRYNLLRDLIQLYSLPINFLRNLAPPQWGAGLFFLHPAWSVPHFSCRSRFATGKTSRQNKKPSAFAGLAARLRPVRPRPRQRLRPGLVESSRLGDMLWLYSPFR